jgi:hypothetical protein
MPTKITIEHDGDWWVVVIERTKRTRRFYLLPDEAAYLAQLLTREAAQVGRLRTCSLA